MTFIIKTARTFWPTKYEYINLTSGHSGGDYAIVMFQQHSRFLSRLHINSLLTSDGIDSSPCHSIKNNVNTLSLTNN